MKIRLVGAKLFDADGQDMKNLTIAFLNFENAPKNVLAKCV